MIRLADISVLFFFSKIRQKKKKDVEEEASQKEELICRFVLDGMSRKIGESVAIDEDILIIKSGNKYLGVPLKHIEEDGKTLLVKGLVDRNKAEEIGEKWRQDSINEIDHNVEVKDGF